MISIMRSRPTRPAMLPYVRSVHQERFSSQAVSRPTITLWRGVQGSGSYPRRSNSTGYRPLAEAMYAFTPSEYQRRRSSDSGAIRAMICAALRLIPTMRNILSNGSVTWPKSSESRPSPARRLMSICQRRSWACTKPVATIRSCSFAASMCGTPYASRSTRTAEVSPRTLSVPVVTGNDLRIW